MTQHAAASAIIIATLVLGGCGTGDHRDAHAMAVLRNELAVGLEAGALPEGHPPVFRGYPALPPGHPPLSDAQPLLPEGHPALPEGHPRCPAGGLMLERPLEEDWDGSTVAAPPLIST
jgi:hypothetical protein